MLVTVLGAGETVLHWLSNLTCSRVCLPVQNARGNTCLHYCYAYKFPDLAEYLMSKGADDSIVNIDGLTCYEAEVAGGLALSEVDNI